LKAPHVDIQSKGNKCNCTKRKHPL
jgi:hypothetical protein